VRYTPAKGESSVVARRDTETLPEIRAAKNGVGDLVVGLGDFGCGVLDDNGGIRRESARAQE